MESHFECMNSYQTDMLQRMEVKVFFIRSIAVSCTLWRIFRSQFILLALIYLNSTFHSICGLHRHIASNGIHICLACCKVKSITKCEDLCALNENRWELLTHPRTTTLNTLWATAHHHNISNISFDRHSTIKRENRTTSSIHCAVDPFHCVQTFEGEYKWKDSTRIDSLLFNGVLFSSIYYTWSIIIHTAWT